MQEIEKKKSVLGIEVPEGWEMDYLDKLTIRGSGHTPDKSFDEYYGGGIKWNSLADSYRLDTGVIFETEVEISKLGIKKSSAVIHPEGTVIMSRDAGVGKSAVMGTEMAVSQHFIAWKCKQEVLDNWFLYYWLQFKKQYFERQAVGSTIKTIGLPLFKKLIIPHPNFAEQRAIADCLSTWDGAIQVSEQLIRQKELQKKWLMQQLLTGKKRLKGFSGEWRERKLGDICKIKKGKSLSSRDLENRVFPVIAGGKSSPYSNSEFSDENVITVSASGAYAGFISFHQYKIWASDCSVIKDVKGVSGIEYLYFLLALNQEKIYKLQTGGAQPHVYPKDLNNFKIFISSCTEEQQAIASILSESDRELDLLRNRLEKIREQKKGLMQVLLTGKRRLRIKEL